ncbi:MAG TPA: cell division protein SepF [Propionibacteriaceae bacterium]|jgi:cell division inhibitor SepF|nr:cell division protein SepF [Propionibacteriaceae bacterium]
MAERLKRAAAWLGLVTDDRYTDYDDAAYDAANYEELIEESSRDEPLAAPDKPATVTPLESRRQAAAASTSVSSSGTTTLAPHARTADVSRITTVHPRTYNEARVIGEHFRDGVPVIMNLSDMEDVDAKRLVDFAAGLIFGLRGSIERVTSKVFLLSPHDVTVAAEDKERIAGGFFNQS